MLEASPQLRGEADCRFEGSSYCLPAWASDYSWCETDARIREMTELSGRAATPARVDKHAESDEPIVQRPRIMPGPPQLAPASSPYTAEFTADGERRSVPALRVEIRWARRAPHVRALHVCRSRKLVSSTWPHSCLRNILATNHDANTPRQFEPTPARTSTGPGEHKRPGPRRRRPTLSRPII